MVLPSGWPEIRIDCRGVEIIVAQLGNSIAPSNRPHTAWVQVFFMQKTE
jgi:hypothetical protein